MEENSTMENQQVENEEVVNNATEGANTEAEVAAEQTPEEQIKALEEKCAKLHDDYIRLYADFENFRKQSLKARAELIKSAGEGIFANMLPLVDDMERAMNAMANATEVSSVKEGVDLIYNKFNSFLAQNGVTPIETEGADFNVDFHEAITMIPAPTEELKGKVIDCTQKGYMLKDKVLRFSKVVVGQ